MVVSVRYIETLYPLPADMLHVLPSLQVKESTVNKTTSNDAKTSHVVGKVVSLVSNIIILSHKITR